MGMLTSLDDVSPSAQVSVPLTAVKSVPATAVPDAVEYETPTAPDAPPCLRTRTVVAPTFSVTELWTLTPNVPGSGAPVDNRATAMLVSIATDPVGSPLLPDPS